MKITVGTTSQTLVELLNADQTKAVNTADTYNGQYDVIIHNGGSETIYLEHAMAATTTDSLPIDTDGSITFRATDLNKENLVAGASNSDVIVSIRS